jgi:hypothetical protein
MAKLLYVSFPVPPLFIHTKFSPIKYGTQTSQNWWRIPFVWRFSDWSIAFLSRQMRRNCVDVGGIQQGEWQRSVALAEEDAAYKYYHEMSRVFTQTL